MDASLRCDMDGNLFVTPTTTESGAMAESLHRTIKQTSSIQTLRHKLSAANLFFRPLPTSSPRSCHSGVHAVGTPPSARLCGCSAPCVCVALEPTKDCGALGDCHNIVLETPALLTEPSVNHQTTLSPDDYPAPTEISVAPEMKIGTLGVSSRTLDTGDHYSTGYSIPGFYNPQVGIKTRLAAVMPTQSVSNITVSGIKQSFAIPGCPAMQPPRTSDPMASLSSVGSEPKQAIPFTAEYSAPVRPKLLERADSTSSLLTASTRSLSSYLSGTGSNQSSRPSTPRSIDLRESPFAKEYVSFPPYRTNSQTYSETLTDTLGDVGKWVGGVGKRLSRKVKRDSLVGQSQIYIPATEDLDSTARKIASSRPVSWAATATYDVPSVRRPPMGRPGRKQMLGAGRKGSVNY